MSSRRARTAMRLKSLPARRQERRQRVGGPQHAIDRPGLAPDLGREPAGQRRDEAAAGSCRKIAHSSAALPLDAAPCGEPAAVPGERQHQQAAADHDPEGEERDHHRRPVGLAESRSARPPWSSASSMPIRLPSIGDRQLIMVGLLRLVGQRDQHFGRRLLVVPSCLRSPRTSPADSRGHSRR